MEYTTIILRHADARVPKFSGLPIDLEGFAYEMTRKPLRSAAGQSRQKTEADAALSERPAPSTPLGATPR